jgi:acetyltransferase-like isoleucine patch superfamily enzyme
MIGWFYFKKNAFLVALRALFNYHFFRRLDIVIGHNVLIKRGNGHHYFGNRVVIYDNAIFEVHDKYASIKTGDDCVFSYGVLLVCSLKISLGNNVWIGEYTSLRDATHNFSVDVPFGNLKDKQKAIKIGNNVWVGRGCLILPGTEIEDNVIIAANSVVKGNCKANSMYGGCPAKFIKKIESSYSVASAQT